MDDYTVNIYLSAPYAGFLFGRGVAAGGICSKAYYDEVGDAGYLEAPIGTGPYKFVEARSGEKIVLEANADYWRGTPAIQHVTIQIVPDVSTQLIGLECGDYDAVRNPSIDSCVRLSGNSELAWDYTRFDRANYAVPGGVGAAASARTRTSARAVQCGINKEEINVGTNSGLCHDTGHRHVPDVRRSIPRRA